MGAMTRIKQGESLPFQFDRGGESLSGWTCTISVKKFPSDTAILSRAITPVGNTWPSFLTQAETALFGIGTHQIIGKLEKTGTDEEEQEVLKFHVQEAWV